MSEKVTLESYMEEVKPGGVIGKRSMLDDYAEELKTLRKRKYTIDQICDYLKKAHGVDAKRATVATYLNRKAKAKAELDSGTKVKPKRKVEQSAVESQTPQATETTAAEQELPKPTRKTDVESGPEEFMND